MSLVANPNAIQDRTLEFKQCVTNFNRINRDKLKSKSSPAPAVNKSEFSSRAGTIAKDIAHATELLGKLALLAKRKPLFDDRPIEIAELTYVIKQDIFRVEKQLKELQHYASTGQQISSSNKSQISTFSKNVLQILNTKTKNMSGEFKSVLEMRQKNEMESKERKNQFLSKSANTLDNNGSGNNNDPLFRQQSSMGGASENPFLSSLATDDPDVSIPGDSPYLSIPEQTQQMALLEEQSQEYLQERNRAVETIESTINEVGNLFQQLATMVNEQGEMIQRIDSNVDDIEMNIQGAQRELLKYFSSISNNRWLYVKIFGILIFFFLLWVLVS
ncbi:t-SNARE syntaxin [Saccharomycopsis crataegensis]|uniref:t-SNARE syntaxin n=1 Tax=Saccharomycopsis crataegensis TaxID=43959 RepID=A0AAV5QIF1_9ASCO|nr:t-SNARE syntaxin [Saccharomycopsis crataegensis]